LPAGLPAVFEGGGAELEEEAMQCDLSVMFAGHYKRGKGRGAHCPWTGIFTRKQQSN